MEKSEKGHISVIDQLKLEVNERDKSLDQMARDLAEKEDEVFDLKEQLEKLQETNQTPVESPANLVQGVLLRYRIYISNVLTFTLYRIEKRPVNSENPDRDCSTGWSI